MPTWPMAIREARRALALSQRAVAEAAGISLDSVRAYEGGRRQPRREHLEQIILALKIPAADANELREALGYTQAMSVFTDGKQRNYYTLAELPAAVEQYPWPEFVVNDAMEVVAANATSQALWGVEFASERAQRTRAQMNLLAVASERRFADRVVNWRDVLETMVGVYKANRPQAHEIDGDNPWFREIIAEFSKGDPRFIAELIDVYGTTPAGVYKYRWDYRVTWSDEEFGEMRFLCICSMANEPEALFFNDWHPVDAESWRALECVKQRARPAPRQQPSR